MDEMDHCLLLEVFVMAVYIFEGTGLDHRA